MPSEIFLKRFRIHELEGRILARRKLAEQDPDRAWHLRYAEIYEAERQRLAAELYLEEVISLNHADPAPQQDRTMAEERNTIGVQ